MPIGYLPYASQHSTLFGLMERQDDTQTYTITVCNPGAVKGLRDGSYLISLPDGIRAIALTEVDRKKMANVLGRIIAEMRFYA